MKKITLIFLLAITIVLFSFRKKNNVFYSKEHFKNEKWYAAMLTKLTKEDRADAATAHWMQMLSSDSYISFEKSMPKLIEKLGKINEKEIRVLFRENEKDPTMFVFVHTTYNFHDLFAFNTVTEDLKRVQNKGIVSLYGAGIEKLSLSENNNEGILFCGSFKQEDKIYKRYLYFNRKENTLEHIKNCEIVKGVKQCKTISH